MRLGWEGAGFPGRAALGTRRSLLVSARYSFFITLETSRGLWWRRALEVKNLDFLLNVIWNQSKVLFSRVAWSDLLFQKISLAAIWKMDWEGGRVKQRSPSDHHGLPSRRWRWFGQGWHLAAVFCRRNKQGLPKECVGRMRVSKEPGTSCRFLPVHCLNHSVTWST